MIGIKGPGRGGSPAGPAEAAPLDLAIEVADELDLPVMATYRLPAAVPAGGAWTGCGPGDILTHCFRPFPNAPDRTAQRSCARSSQGGPTPAAYLFEAIGHGMGGVQTSRPGAPPWPEGPAAPDPISSDVHALSVDGPAYDLA